VRLTAEAYLAHLEREGERLVELGDGADLSARVPSCPDWDLAGLLDHVGAVFRHKTAVLRHGRRPEEHEWASEEPDVVGRLHTALHDLVGELQQRDPQAPTWTWYSADQTVGFWYRRMAQEAAVHRVDAELALGERGPLDDALAIDGIDEFAHAFLEEWSEPEPAASGRTVLLRAGPQAWRLTLGKERITTEDGDGPADLTVLGDPADLLLWVWGGRVGDDVVRVEGPADLRAELQARLHEPAQ
jgi:uncharacterized protein (TIGR03083 family)